MSYSVRVKKGRRGICSPRLIWVKDRESDLYVSKKSRGIWETWEEAKAATRNDSEEIVGTTHDT